MLAVLVRKRAAVAFGIGVGGALAQRGRRVAVAGRRQGLQLLGRQAVFVEHELHRLHGIAGGLGVRRLRFELVLQVGAHPGAHFDVVFLRLAFFRQSCRVLGGLVNGQHLGDAELPEVLLDLAVDADAELLFVVQLAAELQLHAVELGLFLDSLDERVVAVGRVFQRAGLACGLRCQHALRAVELVVDALTGRQCFAGLLQQKRLAPPHLLVQLTIGICEGRFVRNVERTEQALLRPAGVGHDIVHRFLGSGQRLGVLFERIAHAARCVGVAGHQGSDPAAMRFLGVDQTVRECHQRRQHVRYQVPLPLFAGSRQRDQVVLVLLGLQRALGGLLAVKLGLLC